MKWNKFVEQTEHVYIRQAMWYGFDRDSAEDLTYDAYLAILEAGFDPSFSLGYTIMKNSCLNEIRNHNRRTTHSKIVQEYELPMGAKRRMLLDELVTDTTAIMSVHDFNEVIGYIKSNFNGDDYAFIMCRGVGYNEKEMQIKFHMSRYQVQQRLRVIRKHLYVRFPDIFQ